MPAASYETEWGRGRVWFDPSGITRLDLPARRPWREPPAEPPPAVRDLCASLTAYFAGRGELPPADIFRDRGSTPFLRRVYRIVGAIRAGETMTYGAVADAAGRPGAARAVGAAMASNPFAPVIPCHRVVGSDGRLRGYGGGLPMKEAMLKMEGAR